MRRSIRIKNITLIIIMILMVVITVFSSCSAENSSLTLCNVKLDYDNSRSFSELSLDSKLTNSNLLYMAQYLGSGSSYYGAKSDFVPYPEEGLILSQGLWKIDCRWMNGDIIVAEGTTREIWINLNTTSILVYLEENKGKGSFYLGSYKVNCTDHSVTSISYDISLCKYNDGLFDSNIIFADSEIEISADSDIETGIETGCISTLKLKKDDLDSGAYLLTIKVFNGNNKTDANLLFTDVLGFMIKEGHETSITGECEVKKGTTGESIYLPPSIDDPQNPPSSNTVNVGGSNSSQLNNVDITDSIVYVVNPDSNSSTDSPNMTLNHINNSNSSSRIKTPGDSVFFGIDLHGTDVTMSTNDGPNYYKESALIISLENNSTMTLYNSGDRDATWAKINGTRRFETNTILKDGILNIVGLGASENISNAKIFFQGPLWNNNQYGEQISSLWTKQGTINLASDSTHSGGCLVLDGDVEVTGVTGISSWETKKTGSWPPYTIDSSIDGNLDTIITMKNGSRINAVGDNEEGNYNDTATGIYILGNGQGGSINILLDNGHINASGSFSSEEAGIRIENFTGTINITLKNGSSITTSKGYGIKLNECTGLITISVESGCTVNSDIIVNSETMELKKGPDGKLTESKKQSYNTGTS